MTDRDNLGPCYDADDESDAPECGGCWLAAVCVWAGLAGLAGLVGRLWR